MILKDERIIKFLDKRLEENNLDKEKFLYPKISDLRDPFKMYNMDKAVEKIKKAIADKKRILIFGDYDADGICASTILFLFLKSKKANVNVFIPNRFLNGYGLSSEAIETIQEQFAPELIITVDLGITAIEEVELIKQEGMDIIVTDHHMLLDEIPDCICVNPKLDPEGTYGFDALCGAGVVFKLVEAMSSREECLKYIDICAIATIGDIVSLIDENRVIAKYGMAKINTESTLPSIKLLKDKLKITECNSTDVSFKIVPKLNSCGRMSDAIKVFEFLIETNPVKLEEKYQKIDEDNVKRLEVINNGVKNIEKCLENYNRDEPSVLVVGDFHEGVIGILASRICHEFNKPAIIFTRDEYGNLKGSGRSIANVDMHAIASSLSHLLLNFGGHKMACGMELSEENFEEFKTEFNRCIREVTTQTDFIIENSEYDIEITDDDFNESFYKQLSMLEPYGYKNEKPVIAIKQKKMGVEPINDKAFKHYKLYTDKNNVILAFSSYEYTKICKTNSEKLILLDLDISTYKNKKCLNVVSRGLKILDADLADSARQDYLSALYNKYYSIFDFNNRDRYHYEENMCDLIKRKFAESLYGTVVVASSNEDLQMLRDAGIEINVYLSNITYKNGQNVIVSNPRQIYKLKDVSGYKNIIFLHRYFDDEHLFYTQKVDVYESPNKLPAPVQLKKERDIFSKVYKLVYSYSYLKANDILEYAEKLALRENSLNECQILFCLIVFMELNFIEFDETTNSFTILNSKKMELTSSKFFNQVGNVDD